MILPYSTDAPIYYFPWMTIVLVVVNCITFAITGMGLDNEGWLLQYGNGLHPLEWLAYGFLHFGPMHLIGNMFFLWAFGIVVEGKLGWWKFLSIYMGINVVGGMVIQIAMLGHQSDFENAAMPSTSPGIMSLFDPPTAFAQDGDDEVMDVDEEDIAGPIPNLNPQDGVDGDENLDPHAKEILRQLKAISKPGAGGASLAVFALLGIVLVWAPKNEVSCFFLIGLRPGTFEMEYLYFCGFKIVGEGICALLSLPGFEVNSEIAHSIGAILGFGIGTACLKNGWVDCENWDLYAYLQNKHGRMADVGGWQDISAVPNRHAAEMAIPRLGDDDDEWERRKSKKKKPKSKPKPKLKALDSLDDEIADPPDDGEPFDIDPLDIFDEPDTPSAHKVRPSSSDTPAPPRTVRKPSINSLPPLLPPELPSLPGQIDDSRSASPLESIRLAIRSGHITEAVREVQRQRSKDESFDIPREELVSLADACLNGEKYRDARTFYEELLDRYPKGTDGQRLKLAVISVKYLRRPTAALKLLVQIDKQSLSEKHQAVHLQAARLAQKMIAEGMTDAK